MVCLRRCINMTTILYTTSPCCSSSVCKAAQQQSQPIPHFTNTEATPRHSNHASRAAQMLMKKLCAAAYAAMIQNTHTLPTLTVSAVKCVFSVLYAQENGHMPLSPSLKK